MSQVSGRTITLKKVNKSWGDVRSLQDVDLELPAGKFTAILGPSGCGKSTTLRVIAGLEDVSSGSVEIAGRDITNLPPSRRDLSMVFQSYALFPHLSVAENITFGLKVARIPRRARVERLHEVAELLELSPYLDRKPGALSGGQQQRVALGRAVVSRRPVCLMDEPLSNLDARLRDEMRREIRRLQRALGFTMIYVTHDQTEAITMADQVVLMNQGRVEQVASPQDIYTRPATPFAARFIGTPPMNLISPEAIAGLESAPRALAIGLRPETLFLDSHGPLLADARGAEFLGSDTLLELDAAGQRLLAKLPGNHAVEPGQQLRFGIVPEAVHLFDADKNTRIEDRALVARIAGAAT